jgi:hypothetical protein
MKVPVVTSMLNQEPLVGSSVVVPPAAATKSKVESAFIAAYVIPDENKHAVASIIFECFKTHFGSCEFII